MDVSLSVLFVFLGGGFGSVLRFSIERGLSQAFPTRFPFATLTVNLIGSFLIGVLFVCLERFSLSTQYRLFLGTGLLGGFTTFSTFSLENALLFRNASYQVAATNIVTSILVGLSFVLLGIYLANLVLKK